MEESERRKEGEKLIDGVRFVGGNKSEGERRKATGDSLSFFFLRRLLVAEAVRSRALQWTGQVSNTENKQL